MVTTLVEAVVAAVGGMPALLVRLLVFLVLVQLGLDPRRSDQFDVAMLLNILALSAMKAVVRIACTVCGTSL